MASNKEQFHKSDPTDRPVGGPDAATNGPDSTLRLLVGRLCLAGLGRSSELDAQLRRVSQMARSGFDPAQLQSVLDPLTRAVSALDDLEATAGGARRAPAATPPAAAAPPAPPPAPPAPPAPPTPAAPTPAPAATRAPDAASAEPDPQAAEIRDQRAQLLREKAEIEELLRQVDSRLEAITAFFAFEEEQHSTTRTDTSRLNKLVLGEVHEISNDMDAASSLGELRTRVGTRLNTINVSIEDYRQREEQRFTEQTVRTKALKLRVEELERESKVLQQNLREEQRMAQVDTLTGVPNRAAWNERMAKEYSRWQRHGGVVSLLMWDVDHFKSINDEFGHKAGDKMLRVLAQRLMRDLRSSDFVARYGGEEFVMLLSGTSSNDALRIANRVRASVQDLAFHFHDKPIRVTISCGITTFRMGDTPDTAFERADRALYAAKDAGRNRCVVR